MALSVERLLDWLGRVNVTLTTINDGYIAQTQRNDAAGKNVNDISAGIPGFIGVSAGWSRVLFGTHIRSTLVRTPIVRVPSGSTSRAILRPSELAKSVLAGVTARTMQAGLEMYLKSISRICFSMSFGWSPTGTLVKPGKSTRVRVRTLGEKMRRLMGCGEMPALRPVLASVSRTISARILLKS
jgi:hypothetical protein